MTTENRRWNVLGDRYVMTGLAILVAFVSFVAAAYGFQHSTNGSVHGLNDTFPRATTNAPGGEWAVAEFRHYFDDGTWHRQCGVGFWGFAECEGDPGWGTAPCQKRSVNGVDGVLNRHWVRRAGCSGTLHP